MDCKSKNTGKKVRSTFPTMRAKDAKWEGSSTSPSQRTAAEPESVGHGSGELKTRPLLGTLGICSKETPSSLEATL